MSAVATAPGAAWESFEAMLEIGVDAGEAFFTLGVEYDTLRTQLKRKGRADLVEKLTEWRKQDVKRLRRAQGREWW